MSRQSKQAKKAVHARQITELHKQGQRGPKSTTPAHGKNPANRAYTKNKRGPNDNTAVAKKDQKQ